MKELFAKLVFSLLGLCLFSCNNGKYPSWEFSEDAPTDSVLPFSRAQALINDMAFFEQMLQMDSVKNPAYLDSLQKMGIVVLLEKYHISLPILKKTMDFYFSDLDTVIYFFKQLEANNAPPSD